MILGSPLSVVRPYRGLAWIEVARVDQSFICSSSYLRISESFLATAHSAKHTWRLLKGAPSSPAWLHLYV